MPHLHGLREAVSKPQWNPWLESSEHSKEPNMQVLHGAKCYCYCMAIAGSCLKLWLPNASYLHLCIVQTGLIFYQVLPPFMHHFRILQGLCWRYFPSVELLSRNVTDQTSPHLSKKVVPWEQDETYIFQAAPQPYEVSQKGWYQWGSVSEIFHHIRACWFLMKSQIQENDTNNAAIIHTLLNASMHCTVLTSVAHDPQL